MKKIILFYILSSVILSNLTGKEYNQFDHRIGLFPNFFSYEKIKKESLYLGAEGFYNVIGSRFAQVEARLGYNLSMQGNDLLCPYAGVGWLKSFSKPNLKDCHFPYGQMFFGSLGLSYNHELLSIFYLGFRSEILLGSATNKNNFTYGFEGRIPITFLFGHKGKFDFRLEPFAIFLSEKSISSDFYGLLLSMGFKF